jgi:hypothetical protein
MMSPVIYGVGGEIEKYYHCRSCKKMTRKLENFISLNFKRLMESELKEIRQKFGSEGYSEGIRFDQNGKQKWGMLNKLFNRKKDSMRPITTIRDYLCHLNLLQRESAT